MFGNAKVICALVALEVALEKPIAVLTDPQESCGI
jgi:hypothetical protein